MTIAYNTHIDRKSLPVSLAYDSLLDQTEVTFQYPITGTPVVITYGANDIDSVVGEELKVVQVLTSSVKVMGEHLGLNLICGQKYTQRLRLSEPILKAQNQQGQAVANMNRTQIKSVAVHYRDTGYFRIEAKPLYRDTIVKEFAGDLGTVSTTLDNPYIDNEGAMRCPVLSKSDQVTIDVINDSHFPSSFIGLEWILSTVPKFQRA